jgi:hypothetical protein
MIRNTGHLVPRTAIQLPNSDVTPKYDSIPCANEYSLLINGIVYGFLKDLRGAARQRDHQSFWGQSVNLRRRL